MRPRRPHLQRLRPPRNAQQGPAGVPGPGPRPRLVPRRAARRWGRPLPEAGPEIRKATHADHLGIHPQKPRPGGEGPNLFYAGLLVPVGRITTAQMRGVADLAERYGDGQIRLTVQQNLLIPNIPEDRVGAFTQEPLLQELPFDPGPVMPAWSPASAATTATSP